jgi:hypothetical protein
MDMKTSKAIEIDTNKTSLAAKAETIEKEKGNRHFNKQCRNTFGGMEQKKCQANTDIVTYKEVFEVKSIRCSVATQVYGFAEKSEQPRISNITSGLVKRHENAQRHRTSLCHGRRSLRTPTI